MKVTLEKLYYMLLNLGGSKAYYILKSGGPWPPLAPLVPPPMTDDGPNVCVLNLASE